jgi:hypothetical protein
VEALTLLVAVAVVAVAVVAFTRWRRQRSAALAHPHGSEHDRAGAGTSVSRVEELAERRKRRAELGIVGLSQESAAHYRDDWNQIQVRHTGKPGRTVEAADGLVVRIMRESGYPVDHFDERADELAVDHPQVVRHYRDAHGVALAHARGQADTDELRRGVRSFRALVDALLDDTEPPPPNSQGSPDLQEQ